MADALFITQRLSNCLSQGDSDVLCRMMVIDLRISVTFQCEVKPSMSGKELQHMV